MKVAVVGVTGLVGNVVLKILEEEQFAVTEILPVASERSVGKKITFNGEKHTVMGLEAAVAARPVLAIFSAGAGVSLEWAPKFVEVGTYVVDNSSAWRMDTTKKLVIPEVNASVLTSEDRIIANPNCSTIQMVLALAPLHREFQAKRIVVSTYQSVSGTGMKAVRQLVDERLGKEAEMVYPYPIDLNCLPHCDSFLDNGYTKEEMKLVNESRKILGDDSISITATAVRVPVQGGHSEAVNVEFRKPITIERVRELLATTDGITLQDDPTNNIYPMCRFAENKNDVFVGRLRYDEGNPQTLNMWIVADNLRKGAATNAVQIAQYLHHNAKFIG